MAKLALFFIVSTSVLILALTDVYPIAQLQKYKIVVIVFYLASAQYVKKEYRAIKRMKY